MEPQLITTDGNATDQPPQQAETETAKQPTDMNAKIDKIDTKIDALSQQLTEIFTIVKEATA